ncbi:hypothetical protein BDK51DRAFT_35995 [Blyttiomyces helicus]|uniref:Uncharacterized protein n=1 Tax=Blyttiomyces helicus TaxID=388810 RepID=A0A4P9WM75_9FUNG|nr:hypothetical protein BDK51DRAFT_35995 [Blyttiomyces helicus]|eukprot:RKO91806.1 hypothetical protein BDK51DRAFT_35995 [Blyttiomyces helicus]
MAATTSPSSHPSRGLRSAAGLTAVLVFALLLNFGVMFYQLSWLLEPKQMEYSYTGTDFPNELPIKIRTVNMAFNDDPEHYRLKGTQAWAEWNAIRPPGKGYVYLGEVYHSFSIAMWHQLHCLSHLRAVIVDGDDGSDHTEHCFHYLSRMGGPGMYAGEEVVATGKNTTHVCRDWKQIWEWSAENVKTWTPDMWDRLEVLILVAPRE